MFFLRFAPLALLVSPRLLPDDRMGSFTSAPKMVNDDCQDDDVEFGGIETFEALRDRCRDELKELPARIERHFPKARSANENSIRVFQWNILSQCKPVNVRSKALEVLILISFPALGEHNDNFVRCPPEALDWGTRRYRILEEIVEYSPDVICLQVRFHCRSMTRHVT